MPPSSPVVSSAGTEGGPAVPGHAVSTDSIYLNLSTVVEITQDIGIAGKAGFRSFQLPPLPWCLVSSMLVFTTPSGCSSVTN